MKTLIYILLALFFFSSCKQSVFLNRKYTSGRFVESKRTLKHNTIYSDTAKVVASVHSKVNIKSNNNVNSPEQEITNAKITSIFPKKDTIIRVKKRGPDREVVIKSKSPDVYIIVNDIPKPGSPEFKEQIKQNSLTRIKITAVLSLVFALVPIAGFVMAVTCKKRIKDFSNAYNVELKNQKIMSDISLVLSILPSLAATLIAFLFFTALFLFTFSATPVVPYI